MMTTETPQPQQLKISPDFLYRFIYGRLVQKFGSTNKMVSVESVLEVCHRCTFNIPRRYDDRILQDLEALGFIERVNKFKLKFVGYGADKRLAELTEYFLW